MGKINILSQDTNIDIPQTVRRTISFDEFISKEELSNLINALIILDVTDYSNIKEVINIGPHFL